ncbi:MAG: tRNA (N6-isopentenyl adenosine(37)-C2)-methylthiotransferase MiaB [Bacillota bacterium]
MASKDYSRYFHKPSTKDARKRLEGASGIEVYHVPSHLKGMATGRKYKIQTYGCQANEADSEHIKGILETLGFKETEDEKSADFILLNTCAIRENAENRVFGELGRLKQYKRTNPDLLLGVSGCMPQEEKVVNRLLKSYPYVDLIFGTHNIDKLPDYIETALFNKERVVEVFSEEGRIVENLPRKRDHSRKAWVNIMYGCDEFCTYCIVPYTRGTERSRMPEDILREIEGLKEEGYKEVTLLGQNVNAYGRDFKAKDYTFSNLLEAIAKTGIPRVRFTTSHPNDFDLESVRTIGAYGNLMPHIHLPVQSGSDKVLRKMNRKYTRERIYELVDQMRSHIPGVSITTDLIVGFPGEDDDDFEATLEMVRTIGFEGAFTFIFSPREGTPAAKYQDATPVEDKQARLKRLNALVNEGYRLGNKRFEGETVPVLIEGQSKNNGAILAGYSPHNKLVNVKAPADLIGSIVPVRITEAKTWFLEGVVDEDA